MVNVREMTFDDIDEVVEIENENFSTPWPATGFFTYLIRDDSLFLVAEEDGKVEGYIGLIMAAPEGDITNVSVRKSSQNKGIGKMLVEGLVSGAKERGVNDIFLEVRVSNDPAIHLYEKYGFVNVGTRKNYYEAPCEDAYIMKREG